MLVQDPLSKYPRLGKYALIFSIIPGYFHEYDAEEVIQQAVNSQSVHGFLKQLLFLVTTKANTQSNPK